MKRLGMWNRLALVVGVLTILIAPAWNIISFNDGIMRAFSSGLSTCLDAPQPEGTYDPMRYETCSKTWTVPEYAYKNWQDWAIVTAGWAIFVAVLYLLIWTAVSTSKWIWRGRR